MIFTFKDILTPDEILRLRFLNKKILDRIYYFDYVKMIMMTEFCKIFIFRM